MMMALTSDEWLALIPTREYPPLSLLWRLPAGCWSAVLVSRRQGGAILAVPARALDEDLMESAAAANFLGLLGPSIGLEVPSEDEAGIHEDSVMLEVILIDVDDGVAEQLYDNVNVIPDDFGEFFEFINADLEAFLPAISSLTMGLARWITDTGGTIDRVQAYHTADEGADGEVIPPGRRPRVARRPGAPAPKRRNQGQNIEDLQGSLNGFRSSVESLVSRLEAIEGGLAARGPNPAMGRNTPGVLGELPGGHVPQGAARPIPLIDLVNAPPPGLGLGEAPMGLGFPVRQTATAPTSPPRPLPAATPPARYTPYPATVIPPQAQTDMGRLMEAHSQVLTLLVSQQHPTSQLQMLLGGMQGMVGLAVVVCQVLEGQQR